MNSLPTTILLVEKESLIALDETRQLQEEGYTVIHAHNNAEAIAKVTEASPTIHLILTEIYLGDRPDTVEAAQIILHTQDIPIIFLSSYVEKAVIQKVENIPSYGYVLKNTGGAVLAASIQTALKLHAAKTALRESEKRFHSLFDNTTIGMYRTTHDGRILIANSAAVQMLGYPSFEEMAKRDLETDGFEPDYPRSQFQEIMERDGKIIGLESLWTRQDGTTLYVRESAVTVRDENGVPYYYDGTFEDITERKRSENALQEKTEELDRFFSSALDLLCIADTNGYFHRVNREWEKVLGYKMEDLEGMQFLDLVHPDDLPATLEAIRMLEDQKMVLNFTNRYRCQDGSYRWIEWRSTPYQKLIYAAARDITERKRAEAALQQALADKEMLMKELKHRVKNGLNMAVNLIDLEEDNLADQHTRAIFANTRTRLRTTAMLYEQLNQGSRIDRIDLRAYLETLVERLSEAYLDLESMVRIETCCAAVELTTDQAMSLGLIVNELVTNALKYAFPGGRAGVIRVDLQENGGELILCVADNGAGMSATPAGAPGSGLGTDLVKMFVRQLNGRMTIESQDGVKVYVVFRK